MFTFLLSRVAKESEGKVEEKQGDERAWYYEVSQVKEKREGRVGKLESVGPD